MVRPPTRFRSVMLAGLLLLAPTACRDHFPPSVSTQTKTIPAASPGAILPAPLSEPSVAEALYGGGAGRAGVTRWRPKRLWQVGGPVFDSSTAFEAEDLNMIPFEQGGSVRAFLVASIHPPEHKCPTCAPITGAVAITETASGWRVDAVEPELGVWGENGELTGGARRVWMGRNHAGLMLEPTSRKGDNVSKSIILIAERSGSLREVLTVDQVQASNPGNCGPGKTPCFAWDYDWDWIEMKGSEFNAISLTLTGTRLNESSREVQPFTEKRRYEWNGERFAVVTGGSGEQS